MFACAGPFSGGLGVGSGDLFGLWGRGGGVPGPTSVEGAVVNGDGENMGSLPLLLVDSCLTGTEGCFCVCVCGCVSVHCAWICRSGKVGT